MKHKVFEPLPWQVKPFEDTSDVMLLTGSAGGGKSRLAYEKVNAYMLMYPGSTGLVLRKAYDWTLSSFVPAFQASVLGQDCTYCKWVASRSVFEYSNGSKIFVGGMNSEKERESVKSIGQEGGLDICLFEEGTQFDEEDFDAIIARMRGTAGDFQQIIVCTNPSYPTHWIRLRLILGGEASVYVSRAADNTYNPKGYEARLARMRGISKARLADGLWIVGEGVVIDTWLNSYNANNPISGIDGNVSGLFDYIPGGGEVFWAVDDGYAGTYSSKTNTFTATSHPRAILWGQIQSSRIVVFDESYRVKTLAGVHIYEELQRGLEAGYPIPSMAFYDRAAPSLAHHLRESGIDWTYPTPPRVADSLEVLTEQVGPDENNYRYIVYNPRCHHSILEYDSYVRGDNGKPLKQFDHGIDAIRGAAYNLMHGDAMPSSVDTTHETLTINGQDMGMSEVDKMVNSLVAAAMKRADDKLKGLLQ